MTDWLLPGRKALPASHETWKKQCNKYWASFKKNGWRTTSRIGCQIFCNICLNVAIVKSDENHIMWRQCSNSSRKSSFKLFIGIIDLKIHRKRNNMKIVLKKKLFRRKSLLKLTLRTTFVVEENGNKKKLGKQQLQIRKHDLESLEKLQLGSFLIIHAKSYLEFIWCNTERWHKVSNFLLKLWIPHHEWMSWLFTCSLCFWILHFYSHQGTYYN